MEYLRKLLRSRHLPASRPKWWERLTIDLGHKGNLNQPLQVGWRACITLSSTIRHNCAISHHITSHLPVSFAVSVHSSQAWEECRNALTDPYFEQQRAQHTHGDNPPMQQQLLEKSWRANPQSMKQHQDFQVV